MTDVAVIQVEADGDEQIVRLPEGFRLPGGEVCVSRSGRGVLLEPPLPKVTPEEIRAMFAEMDRIGGDLIFPNGREQPPMPPDDDIDPFD